MSTTQTQVRSTEEVLKLALEALEHMCHYTRAKVGYKSKIIETAMSAAEEALMYLQDGTQPEQQEPVASKHYYFEYVGFGRWVKCDKETYDKTPEIQRLSLYTAPPTVTEPHKRTWEGLTVGDKMAFLVQDFGGNRLDAMDWAEERLKEKNNG